MRQFLGRVLILCVLAGIAAAMPEKASATEKGLAEKAKEEKYLSVQVFARKLEKKAGIRAGTLIEEGEFPDRKAPITWIQAAVLANRADEVIYGADYDKNLYKQIVDKRRLTGLKGIAKEEKKAARLCFLKGIVSGDSNGAYSQSRAFRAKDKITTAEAHKILARLVDKEKRISLSPDGQVIRKTNLPKNYKKFDYILASFPNEFYERKFYYEMFSYYYQPENLVDFACPADMKKVTFKPDSYVKSGTFTEEYEKYGEAWLNTIQTNLEQRFNFDYRTVDDKWISRLAGTYIYSDEDVKWNKMIIDHIGNYIKTAQKNHVVINADKIVVEPSTLYYDGSEYYIRCYVHFKISADKVYTARVGWQSKQHELIFSKLNAVNIENLKKNQWHEMSIDMPVRQVAGNQNPSTFFVGTDQIWPWE